MDKQWTTQRANDWYQKQPWLIGCNFFPAYAINQLEMFQKETFNPLQIDEELALIEKTGMNTVRVFLHDLLWEQDPEGFKERFGMFLKLADKHHIKTMPVLFDSCWDPKPEPGKQREADPLVHNSGAVQSPGAVALADAAQRPRLEAYVKGVISAFAHDKRIVAWDVFNEPDMRDQGRYKDPENKLDLVRDLLFNAFKWARQASPDQPLTSGVWNGADYSSDGNLSEIQKIQLTQSDFISFHNYAGPNQFEEQIIRLKRFGRPIICTEFLVRPDNTFQTILPILKKHHVGGTCWGFITGKSATNMPWQSHDPHYVHDKERPPFHDIYKPDRTPYYPEEVAFIRQITKPENRFAINEIQDHGPIIQPKEANIAASDRS